MRTPTELQEKIDHLVWFKQETIYYFKIIPLSAPKHAVLASFFRTIDNEISMLRWALGQVEDTWSDDLSNVTDMVDYVERLPPTEFPHLPHKANPSTYWGSKVVPPCPYFLGPDSPSDDPNFDPAKALDPSTWTPRPVAPGPIRRFCIDNH